MAGMSPDDIRSALYECIASVAPEADFASIRGDRPWRDQLEVDSFDLQNILIAVDERFAVDIPERDYPKLITLDGFVAYLSAALH